MYYHLLNCRSNLKQFADPSLGNKGPLGYMSLRDPLLGLLLRLKRHWAGQRSRKVDCMKIRNSDSGSTFLVCIIVAGQGIKKVMRPVVCTKNR